MTTMTAEEFKKLGEENRAAHQRTGYLYGIALAKPTEENRLALSEARKISRQLARKYRKAFFEFQADMAARERDAKDQEELHYPHLM